MKYTLTELTAILEELILDNGTAAVVNCLQDALCNQASACYKRGADDANKGLLEMAQEWRRQASAVSRAVQEIG